jgi:hypothetical protein
LVITTSHPRLSGKQPGDRDLSRSRLLASGDLAEQIGQGWFALRAVGVKRETMLRTSALSNVV